MALRSDPKCRAWQEDRVSPSAWYEALLGYVAAVRLRLASQAGCSAHQATVAENSRGIPLGLAPGIALAWGDVA